MFPLRASFLCEIIFQTRLTPRRLPSQNKPFSFPDLKQTKEFRQRRKFHKNNAGFYRYAIKKDSTVTIPFNK